MRHDLGRAPANRWESHLGEIAPDAVCMMLVPKPHDGPDGPLHRVIVGVEGSGSHFGEVELVTLASEEDWSPFSEAYLDRSKKFSVDGFVLRRTHSPGAGMDHGPYAKKGYGFALYLTLALRAIQDFKDCAGAGSPEGGASESAEEMWENLVDIGAADRTDSDPETDEIEHCERIHDSDAEVNGRSATIVDDEVCGSVPAETSGDSVRYLAAWNLLSSGWLLDWKGASAWYTRVGGLKLRTERAATLRDWKADPEKLVRADPGPDATPAQVMFIADRILVLSDHATRLRFLQRPDIFARLPVPLRAQFHPDQTKMHFLSGVGRRSVHLGAAAELHPQPLSPPSASYKAEVAKWAAIDY